MANAPKIIKDFPGRMVEWHYRTYGRLPNEEPMKQPPMSLTDRLELAAQACRAACLLSCEETIREAIAKLKGEPPAAPHEPSQEKP